VGELADELEMLDRDDAIHAIVLTGAGERALSNEDQQEGMAAFMAKRPAVHVQASSDWEPEHGECAWNGG
jgi:hypothetical protein